VIYGWLCTSISESNYRSAITCIILSNSRLRQTEPGVSSPTICMLILLGERITRIRLRRLGKQNPQELGDLSRLGAGTSEGGTVELHSGWCSGYRAGNCYSSLNGKRDQGTCNKHLGGFNDRTVRLSILSVMVHTPIQSSEASLNNFSSQTMLGHQMIGRNITSLGSTRSNGR
jgi:hypothetical protein